MTRPDYVPYPSREKRLGYLLPALLFFFTLILLGILYLINNQGILRGSWLATNTSVTIVCLSLFFLLLTAIPFFIGRRFDNHDWFSFLYLAAASYALHFSFRAFYILANPSTIMGSFRYWETFIKALLVVNVGFLFLLLGYYLPIAPRIARALPLLPFQWPEHGNLLKILFIYLLGFFGRWLASLQILPPTFAYYPLAFSKLTLYSLILISIYAFFPSANQHRFRIALLALLPFQVVYALIWGNGKVELILPVVIILISKHYLKAKIRPRQLILAALLIFIIIFPVIGIYRNLPSSDFISHTTQTFEFITKLDFNTYLTTTIGFVMRRSHLLDSLAVIIHTFPGKYLGITDYLLIPAYTFVPRFIWKTKPTNLGVEFAQSFFDVSTRTAFAISTPADLFQHGGLLVVIIGLFLFGLFYRFVHQYLIIRQADTPKKQKLPAILFYTIAYINLYMTFETQLTTGLIEFIKQLLFITIISFFMQPWKFKRESIPEQ